MTNFSGMCADQLRQAQLNNTSLEDLVASLKQEAKSLGVDFRGTPELGGWPFAVPSDTEATFADNIADVSAKYADWAAHGRPTPPPLP